VGECNAGRRQPCGKCDDTQGGVALHSGEAMIRRLKLVAAPSGELERTHPRTPRRLDVRARPPNLNR
jgi:hypothetical protein